MKRLSLALCVLALVALSALPVLAADDMVANPVYQQWAKFKAGSFAKYTQVMDLGTMKTETEMIMTLTEMTPEKAVIETKMSTMVEGKKTEMPANKTEFAAKVLKTDPSVLEDAKMAAAKKTEETVTVAGKAIKCQVMDMTTDQEGTKVVTKIFTSDTVPGVLVKSVTSMDQPAKSTTTMTLVDFK